MSATITVECPRCKTRMRASADHIGRKGRCPGCKSLLDIKPAADESLATMVPTGTGVATPASKASTEGNVWLAAMIGVAVTALLYFAVFYPLSHTYLGELMTDRGRIQHTITLVTCWGLALLVLKYIAVQKQLGYTKLELELIPLDIGVQINAGNVDQFLEHLESLPRDQRGSLLGERIRGALEYFKFRNSVSETQGYLSTQASLAASAVDSGYTLLRAFIWVCPILGFVGTVVGISVAVTDLRGTLARVGAPEANQAAAAEGEEGKPAPVPVGGAEPAEAKPELKDAMLAGMEGVTKGLATAFDTTLLGLVCVIILMFPTETLRKVEYGMLDRIEEFTNESLLRRMADGGSGGAAGGAAGELPALVKNTLESAFAEHQRWLAQWQAQVARLGQAIGADFESAVLGIQEKAGAAEAARLKKVERGLAAIEEMFAKVNESAASAQKARLDALEGVERTTESVQKLQAALAQNAELLVRVVQEQKELAGRQLADGALARLAEIQSVLAELSAKTAAPIELARSDGNAGPGRPGSERGLLGRILGRG